ncbi:MAG TPA: PKD domain-containing protein [Anaerolineales bacterium]|nr:PKD domain-containing protein [Anaerolineales bacterium]
MKINPFSKRRSLAVIGILTLLMGLFPGSVFAAPQLDQMVVPVPGPAVDVNVAVVNDSAGNQTDPHVSGDWVSYTDNSVYGVRFQNLDLGFASDRLIPTPGGFSDSLSDISSSKVVFMRATVASQSTYLVQIDPFGNPSAAVEVSPLAAPANALRRRSVIGGDTIAYEDRTYDPSSSPQSEISLSNVEDPVALPYRLTNDTLDDLWPAVSPDGNAIVWIKCADYTSNACDVWRAERTAGVWSAPEQVTGAEGTEVLPDANGPVTVYSSTAGGDDNIRWSVKDSSGAYVESVLDLPGVQRNPNIVGDLIAFESNVGLGTQFDIWLYDLATNRLYQLTDTPVSETLTDVTIGYRDVVRVVWAQTKPVYPYDMDVYALSVVLPPSDNTAPTADPSGPYLGAMNTSIAFDGSLSLDPENNALTYAWTFGDGATGTDAASTHSYTAAGVYNVCLTVNDGSLDSEPACTLAVVYDPSAGFATGGGWIDSPARAYKADETLAGKATFGFVSKYQKGASVPTGNTAFEFDLAGLAFSSQNYEWLVVNRATTNAQFKGTGMINGALDPNGNVYKFMLWAGDGSPDTFRIRIWWEDAAREHDVYDNGAAQPIGGSIVVHTGK